MIKKIRWAVVEQLVIRTYIASRVGGRDKGKWTWRENWGSIDLFCNN